MNKDNILAVADAIENSSIKGLGFNMAMYYAKSEPHYPDQSGHNCGTVACIAGWAYSVKQGGKKALNTERAEEFASDYAEDFLGLDSEQAYDLFLPTLDPDDVDHGRSTVTPSQAVAVLRHLAETGEVYWPVADTLAVKLGVDVEAT